MKNSINSLEKTSPQPSPLGGEGVEGKPISFYINVAKGGKESELQDFLKAKSCESFSEMDGDQVKNLKFIDMCTGPHVENTREFAIKE